MCRLLSEINKKDGIFANPNSQTPPPSHQSSTTYNRISPAVLLVIIVLAVVFFVSGLLHLLVRFLKKTRTFSPIFNSNRYPEASGPNSLQRQLQQLFRQHDSGLDQAFIDALPVFCYKDIKGLKEQFDCAVCLCEFSGDDKLRLLPGCSHAFHIHCIDTWLLSNSTCPICRGTLLNSSPRIENPLFNNLDPARQTSLPHKEEDDNGTLSEAQKRVVPVRLGKFRSLNIDGSTQEAETSRCSLDARRCYSMGRVQYVENEANLQVSLSKNKNNDCFDCEGDDTINASASLRTTKSDSFSVSKIWLWSNKKSNRI